jgi:hypothetical protein
MLFNDPRRMKYELIQQDLSYSGKMIRIDSQSDGVPKIFSSSVASLPNRRKCEPMNSSLSKDFFVRTFVKVYIIRAN